MVIISMLHTPRRGQTQHKIPVIKREKDYLIYLCVIEIAGR